MITAFVTLGITGYAQEPLSSKKNAGVTTQTTTVEPAGNTKDAVTTKKKDTTPVKETKEEQPGDKAKGQTQSSKKQPD